MDNNISDLSIIILVTFHGVIHEVITAFIENRGVWVEYMSALSMLLWAERDREMFYLTTHSTNFIYGYMASYIWLRTILIVRKETRCCHIGYSYRLTAFYMQHPTDRISHTTAFVTPVVEHWLEWEIDQWVHEGSLRRPIAPWVNAQPLSYVPLLWAMHCR